MRQFTSIRDVTDPKGLLNLASTIKQDPFGNKALGTNKTLGLIFFNPSLRTRLSTQKAAYNLGMNVMVMNISGDGWNIEFEDGAVMNGNTQEHIKEAAGVISQYCDVIGIRTFAGLSNREEDYEEKVLRNFIEHALVPVISLESATLHPLQSLADWLTIQEHQLATKPKVVLTWAPHPRALPQAVANSFVEWMSQADVELVVTHPEGYALSPDIIQNITVITDQNEALANADFVYAKNWSCYNDYGKILTPDSEWMITAEEMSLTNNGHFMHCLPVRRNVIVTDEVIDSPQSLVLQQSQNRVFAAQAVLTEILQHG